MEAFCVILATTAVQTGATGTVVDVLLTVLATKAWWTCASVPVHHVLQEREGDREREGEKEGERRTQRERERGRQREKETKRKRERETEKKIGGEGGWNGCYRKQTIVSGTHTQLQLKMKNFRAGDKNVYGNLIYCMEAFRLSTSLVSVSLSL